MNADMVDLAHLGFEVMNSDECQATSGGGLIGAVGNKDPLAIAFCCLFPSVATVVAVVETVSKK